MRSDIDELISTPFTWANKDIFIRFLPHKEQTLFACLCAEQVLHLAREEDREVCKKAIETAYKFIEGRASKEDCKKAAYAANTAAYAAHAANTAVHVAYAANAAAHVAYAAAYAANAAAYAANAAAYAANAAYNAAYNAASTSASSIIDQIMESLREHVINSLPEEHKNCWLLVVSI